MLTIESLGVGFVRYQGWFGRAWSQPLRDVSLHANAGELVALIGASGAGKSLLAHAVLGILPANARVSGRMQLQGEVLTPARQRAWRGTRMALVPQAMTYLDPTARAHRPVRWAAESAHLPQPGQQATRELQRYGLAAAAQARYPCELSGGMARRVLAAMATVSQADLLIADEPTTGLDPETAAAALAHLRGLADQGKAVLVISHDLAALYAMADRFVVLRAGTLVESLPSADFQAGRARAPYTRALRLALPQHGLQVPEEPADA